MKDVKDIFQHQDIPYVLKIIYYKVKSHYHNDLQTKHSAINETKELVAR